MTDKHKTLTMEMMESGEGGTLLEPAVSHSDEDGDSETSSEDSDLTLELQNTIPEYYKKDQSTTNIAQNLDEELQASALCQFMDILNDLDDVLDKSLLACVDEAAATLDEYLDEGDVICRGESASTSSVPSSSVTQLTSPCGSKEYLEDISLKYRELNRDVFPIEESESQDVEMLQRVVKPLVITELHDDHSIETIENNPESSIQQSNVDRNVATLINIEATTNDPSDSKRTSEVGLSQEDEVRSSMRRLDPIVMPTLAEAGEPLTLPVILFLEHHVNMRPNSAPIHLQVRAANVNVSSDGPLMLGRRTLIMNRTLSLPSPVDSEVADTTWEGQTARSTSSSSTESTESLEQPALAAQTMHNERISEEDDVDIDCWPHRLSAMLACLSCTVGLFNISRFAIFSVHFGANFIIQFFTLSLIVGIPLLTLHLCLGQTLSSGPMDMWRISPIFQGVGVALLITQLMVGVYSVLGVSWVFVYLRDSFITGKDQYRWAVPVDLYGEDPLSLKINMTYNLRHTLPQYFHGEVLQRANTAESPPGTIKFQVAFNLAIVWMIVFVCLSKGLRSYGKAVYALMFLPIFGTLVLCTKLLAMIPHNSVVDIFSQTEWTEFFINSNSWSAAAQETFLTWGLLGSCIMQLTSHKSSKNKTDKMLQKESACIVAFTFAILLLAAFLANTCVMILKSHGYLYMPSSYETVPSCQFLWRVSEQLPGPLGQTPVRYMGHYGSLVGVSVWRGGEGNAYSGWQPLQLATQLVPATLAAMTSQQLSPVWAVMFYMILIMFGLGQQLAVWHCVIRGIVDINTAVIKPWETTVTFVSCVSGLLLGLLFTTDAGVRLIHWMDYVIVGMWWQCLLYVVLICGVFLVRGRPYSGDTLVTALYASGGSKCTSALGSLLSLTWNLTAPVIMCALCVVDFRIGRQRQLYSWRRAAPAYWAVWARQLGATVQLSVLLTVPAAAFVQTWRYMSKGPPDILERVQNLYRPRMGDEAEYRQPGHHRPPAPPPRPVTPTPTAPEAPLDPPPKYTPPPSYSTATGARLLNTIRRSFRTLRRITSSLGETNRSDTAPLPITAQEPPQYLHPPSIIVTDETDTTTFDTIHRRNNDLRGGNNDVSGINNDILCRNPNSSGSIGSEGNSLSLTRNFLRRSLGNNKDGNRMGSSLRRSLRFRSALTTSHEHLVHGAEPISNTVAMSQVTTDDVHTVI